MARRVDHWAERGSRRTDSVRTLVDERPEPIVQPGGRGRVEPIVAPEIVRTGEGCEHVMS